MLLTRGGDCSALTLSRACHRTNAPPVPLLYSIYKWSPRETAVGVSCPYTLHTILSLKTNNDKIYNCEYWEYNFCTSWEWSDGWWWVQLAPHQVALSKLWRDLEKFPLFSHLRNDSATTSAEKGSLQKSGRWPASHRFVTSGLNPHPLSWR